MNDKNLNSFLEFGYFLYYKPKIEFDFSRINVDRYLDAEFEDLLNEGFRLWRETIHKQFNPNIECVVPLSGGIDSRAILSTLLELTTADNIYTYTFGLPGTYDYEIGNLVAHELGTRHLKVPLDKFTYDQDQLIEISKRIDYQTLLFLHPPMDIIDDYCIGKTVWTGTIIDVFFGRHTHVKESDNWEDAIINSFRENIFVNSTKLSNCDYSNLFDLVDIEETHPNLSKEHIIDLKNRQIKFIYPHVLMKGFDYKTLLNEDLMNFAISIDQKYNHDQFFYKSIFLKAYPKIFSLPNKTTNGLPLNASSIRKFTRAISLKVKKNLSQLFPLRTDPRTNYINFNFAIRERDDLRKIVRGNIFDFKDRGITDWIDLEGLWKNHLEKYNDHGDALLTIASLELHLKSNPDLPQLFS